MRSLLLDSLRSSLSSALLIIKIIVPFYILADLLLYYEVLQRVSWIFTPITTALGLPAEAAAAVAGGMFINVYAALAFAAPLGLSPFQWTILGVFLGVCHGLLVENAIMARLGLSQIYSYVLRFVVAFLCVIPVLFLPEQFFSPDFYLSTKGTEGYALANYNGLGDLLFHSFLQSVELSVKIILLIALIILAMDLLRATPLMQRYTARVNSSFSLLAGNLLGITYGAGILIKEAESGNLSREELFYTGTFLMICHSVIEDVLLFVIFGANYWVIVAVRLVAAVIISWILLKAFIRYPVFSTIMKRVPFYAEQTEIR